MSIFYFILSPWWSQAVWGLAVVLFLISSQELKYFLLLVPPYCKRSRVRLPLRLSNALRDSYSLQVKILNSFRDCNGISREKQRIKWLCVFKVIQHKSTKLMHRQITPTQAGSEIFSSVFIPSWAEAEHSKI